MSSGQLQVSTPALQGPGRNTQSLGVGLADQTLKRGHPSEMISYPSKSQRLEEGSQATQIVSTSSANIHTAGTGLVAGSKVSADSVPHSQKLQVLLTRSTHLAISSTSIFKWRILFFTNSELSNAYVDFYL